MIYHTITFFCAAKKCGTHVDKTFTQGPDSPLTIPTLPEGWMKIDTGKETRVYCPTHALGLLKAVE